MATAETSPWQATPPTESGFCQICKSQGLRFSQFMKNGAYHAGIKFVLYNALFGCEPQVGLTSVTLPPEVIEQMTSEDKLLSALSSPAPVATKEVPYKRLLKRLNIHEMPRETHEVATEDAGPIEGAESDLANAVRQNMITIREKRNGSTHNMDVQAE